MSQTGIHTSLIHPSKELSPGNVHIPVAIVLDEVGNRMVQVQTGINQVALTGYDQMRQMLPWKKHCNLVNKRSHLAIYPSTWMLLYVNTYTVCEHKWPNLHTSLVIIRTGFSRWSATSSILITVELQLSTVSLKTDICKRHRKPSLVFRGFHCIPTIQIRSAT